MSLEFALQYACPLRANYSERHLREWGRLSSLHAKLTTDDAGAPSIDKLEWVEKASAEINRSIVINDPQFGPFGRFFSLDRITLREIKLDGSFDPRRIVQIPIDDNFFGSPESAEDVLRLRRLRP